MMFKRNADNETIKILLNENKRLKRRNQQLEDSLNELQRYRDEYKNLVTELRQAKHSYARKLDGFDRLEQEYRRELNRILDSENRRR